MRAIVLASALAAMTAAPAAASDLFGGVYKHAAYFLPTSANTHQGGKDFELGYRFGPVLGFLGGPAPHVLASINDRGDASFVAVGLSWKLGLGPVYVRPGIGVAVQDGPTYHVGPNRKRDDLGSRVLFEPELALGVAIAPRLSVEASWVHISHAQLFGPQNPGLDMLGARINLHLP